MHKWRLIKEAGSKKDYCYVLSTVEEAVVYFDGRRPERFVRAGLEEICARCFTDYKGEVSVFNKDLKDPYRFPQIASIVLS